MLLRKIGRLKLRNFILLSIVLMASSCRVKSTAKLSIAELPVSPIVGLASPIKLGIDSTTVYAQDYFLHPDSIDSITVSPGLSIVPIDGFITFYLIGSPANQIANLRFWLGGCSYDIPVKKSDKIRYTFTLNDPQKKYDSIFIGGSMNGWVNNQDALHWKNGKWEIDFVLNPGNYAYHLWIDGSEGIDPTNEQTESNGMGGVNSIFKVGDAAVKKPQVSAHFLSGDTLQLETTRSLAVYWQNHLLNANFLHFKDRQIQVLIPENAQSVSRSFIRAYAFNENQKGSDLLIPLNHGKVVTDAQEITRKEQQSFIMYFMMVDRFKDGNIDNNHPVIDRMIDPRVNFYGGDMDGVTDEINANYFDSLGVNTIWLSPIGKNPDGAWGLWVKSKPTTKFSGYHGYWPAESKAIDARFGTNTELDALITDAHKHHMNVLLDYVANHVHQDHPVIKQHPDWATPFILPDGRKNTELWDEQRLTTWFDDFLPTLDLENPEVAEAMTDSALYWLTRFELDGLRHDATKHIPESFWRLLNVKLKNQVIVPQNRAIYQIGETYGNPELIGSYINSGMLDAQFDFNLYDQAVQAFGRSETSFENLSKTLQESIYNYGSHHVMGNISGNQDRCRFISYADGSVQFDEDAKVAGWTREITNQGEIGYQRLAMLHAFNFAVPGIPVIYYGDEIGLAGANDPDNRRMMQFEGLDSNAITLKTKVEKLTRLRRNNMALMYGQTKVILANNTILVLKRTYLDQTVLVIFNKSTQPISMGLDLKELENKRNFQPIFGSEFYQNKGLDITVAPMSFEFLVSK
tara:strand:- start:3693 stop:6095 length:2403 start_codon:yes stop_codon:yes gene_type:complete